VAGTEVTAENLSQYGTSIDDRPLTEPTRLQPGQRLQIGGHTVLVVEQTDEPDEPPNEFDLLSRADAEIPRDIIARAPHPPPDADTNVSADDFESFPGGEGRR
jgi:predicted component of type VI protein secretion system